MIEELRRDLFRIMVPLPDSPLKFLNSYVVSISRAQFGDRHGLNRTSASR